MAKKKGAGFNFVGNLVAGAGKAGGRIIEDTSKVALGAVPKKAAKVKSLW